jgi:hypothetical protein
MQIEKKKELKNEFLKLCSVRLRSLSVGEHSQVLEEGMEVLPSLQPTIPCPTCLFSICVPCVL